MNAPVMLTVPERNALRATVLCLALLGGAGLFLGYANPFYQLPPLVLFFPACLATLARIIPTVKGSFYAGWLCATIGNSACLYWISVPMHDYGMVPWALTVPAVLALGAYLGLYGGLFALFYRLFRDRLPFFAALVLVCPLWAALDTAKEYLFTGFPWVTLSVAFIPWTEWVQAASAVGSTVLSGIFAMVAVALAEARPIRLSLGSAPAIMPKKRERLCLLLAVLPLLLVYGCSFLPPLPEGRSVTVGLVQGNVDQNQKWDPAYQTGTLARYLTLSEWTVNPAMGRLQKPVDFILWPETAMPFYLESNAALADRLITFSARFSVPLVFGAPGKSDRPDGTGFYNRMWLQTPTLFERQSYDKQHLVPFGEYVPLSIPLPFIEYLMQGLDFIPGTSQAPLRTGDLALGGLICYEAIFPDLARQRVADGANILVNISNDAWFGYTAAPVQHLHLTAMRAVEQGRYIARATNTGISAVITPRGAIAARGSLFKAESLVGTARLVSGLTVYHRIGPFLLWGCIILSLTTGVWCLVQERRRAKDPRERA
ncbi:Apolipoprotein N-acyltransferase [uncultured delta proteobacterium]|uniref:Apolipoprotein N-acyltransferase n=1 Tax=uncultured delta proteobacterium TaxID=34034 RepID=A0A212JMF0_9DELT|nr:Apolipoprotein N-acyltransferase [uncultured delta proteobacterium]